MTQRIPFHDLGGNGPLLHFAHANGYHPNSYHELLRPLTEHFRVVAYEARPFWSGSDPLKIKKWDVIADDLVRFMDENGFENAIGMGHSLGGITTALAALKRPDLFNKLILLDPVLLPDMVYWMSMLPRFLKIRLFPIAKIAQKRRDTWASKQAAFDYLRKKRVFQRISDTVFKDVITHGIKESNGEAKLSYSKAWETQIYLTPTNLWPKLSSIKQDTLAIRGTQTDVLVDPAWQKWQRKQPSAQFHSIDEAGHLVPLEQPRKIVELVQSFAL